MFNTIAAFVAGSLAGNLLTRVVKPPRAGADLALVAPARRRGVPSVRRLLGGGRRQPVVQPAGPVPTERNRARRLPLPQLVADLTSADAPTLSAVDVFADELSALPLERWLEIGRAMIGGHSASDRRSSAIAFLEATILTRELSIAAWYVRDAIDTSAYAAGHSVLRLTSSDRRLLAAAHGAAEDAALALLARDELRPEDLAVLLAPFNGVTTLGPTSADRHVAP